jgi:hypothetical protein
MVKLSLCERLRLTHFQTFGSQMAVRLSALSAPPPQEDSWYSFLLERLSAPQGYSAAGRSR